MSRRRSPRSSDAPRRNAATPPAPERDGSSLRLPPPVTRWWQIYLSFAALVGWLGFLAWLAVRGV